MNEDNQFWPYTRPEAKHAKGKDPQKGSGGETNKQKNQNSNQRKKGIVVFMACFK